MFSAYFSFGRFRGFRIVHDGPELWIRFGWMSVCFVSTDLEQLMQDILAELREYDRRKPHIKQLEERIIKMLDGEEQAHSLERELRQALEEMDDEVMDAQAERSDMEERLTALKHHLDDLYEYWQFPTGR